MPLVSQSVITTPSSIVSSANAALPMTGTVQTREAVPDFNKTPPPITSRFNAKDGIVTSTNKETSVVDICEITTTKRSNQKPQKPNTENSKGSALNTPTAHKSLKQATSADVYSFDNEELSDLPVIPAIKKLPTMPSQYVSSSSTCITDKVVSSRETAPLHVTSSTTCNTFTGNTCQETGSWSSQASITTSLCSASGQITEAPSETTTSSKLTVTKGNNYCSPLLNTSYRPSETLAIKPVSYRSSETTTAGRAISLRKQPSQTSTYRHFFPGANGFSLDGDRPVNGKTSNFPLSFYNPKRQDRQDDVLDYDRNTEQAACIISTTSGLEPPSVSVRFNNSSSLEGTSKSLRTVRSILSPQVSSYTTTTTAAVMDSELNNVCSSGYDVSQQVVRARAISTPSRTGQTSSLTSTVVSSQSRNTADTVNSDLQNTPNYCMQTVLRVLSNSVSELTNEVKRSFASVQSKLDTINKRILATEMDVSNIRRRIDKDEADTAEELNVPDFESIIEDSEENYNNIPIAYRLSISELKSMANTSCSPGNFGKKLTERMFPELFGPGKERMKFNWNGTRGKKELNLVKKAVIRKYIQSIFPECRGKESFAKVVDAINEGLRRPEEKKRDKNKNYMYNNEVVVEIHEGELGALDETDYLEDDLFTDSHSFDNL